MENPVNFGFNRVVGKPFDSELEKLPETSELAHRLSVADLSDAVNSARSGSVYLIGTGGSLSAAEFAARLFDQSGGIARALTPLSFLQSGADMRETSVFIFSAGGNNKDVLAAFDAAKAGSAFQIVNVCATEKNKLAKRAVRVPCARHISFSLSSGRDGYLATNSLLATTILVARAFQTTFELVDDVALLVDQGRRSFSVNFKANPPKHVVILFSEWGRLAATDLESKLSEAGIAGSMLADYRHFAHGRHNWLDKQSKQTAVVAFSNSEDNELADRTLKELPASVQICRFHSNKAGPTASIAQLLNVFGFISAFGSSVGIDPGRPGVPGYGSTLYHLGPLVRVYRERTAKTKSFDVPAGVARKLRGANFPPGRVPDFNAGATAFIEKIRAARFGALVADIDGTILPQAQRDGPIPDALAKKLLEFVDSGLALVLATGRGDSIQQVLERQFPRRTWPQIYIGYLNGAFCLPLSRSADFSDSCFDVDDVYLLYERLEQHTLLLKLAHIKNNKCQITLRARNSTGINAILQLVQAEIDAAGVTCRVVASAHSIDVLPSTVTKATCITFAASLVQAEQKVLAIGDSGCHPGNDFELLNHEYSLSVDSVSPCTRTCWNFLPPDLRNVDGTLFYLAQTRRRPKGAGFTIHP